MRMFQPDATQCRHNALVTGSLSLDSRTRHCLSLQQLKKSASGLLRIHPVARPERLRARGSLPETLTA